MIACEQTVIPLAFAGHAEASNDRAALTTMRLERTMAKPIPTPIPDDVKARFWAKVDVRGPDECWPWTACTVRDGRGLFRISKTPSIRHHAPHVSLVLKLGRPLREKCGALHACDNPYCVNPAHLWEGTQAENLADCLAKGRRTRRAK